MSNLGIQESKEQLPLSVTEAYVDMVQMDKLSGKKKKELKNMSN